MGAFQKLINFTNHAILLIVFLTKFSQKGKLINCIFAYTKGVGMLITMAMGEWISVTILRKLDHLYYLWYMIDTCPWIRNTNKYLSSNPHQQNTFYMHQAPIVPIHHFDQRTHKEACLDGQKGWTTNTKHYILGMVCTIRMDTCKDLM